MKRSDAARYARWSALAAMVLAGITGGIYLYRQWVAHVERTKAPPPLTEDKERQSIGLTLSKNEGDRTIFTVQASKSTDFKGQDISLLEDVKITVYGKTGERHDIIHTQSCNYAKTDGAIQCSGIVQMELQSAEDAQREEKRFGAKANVIHVETSGVTFERSSGQAQTVQPVKFSFANGSGEGVGAVYSSEQGTLRLVKDVRITLQPEEPLTARARTGAAGKEVLLQGSSLNLVKLSRKAVLSGPATATTDTQQLYAGQLSMLMDAQFRAQALVAEAGARGETPELVSHGQKEATRLRADMLRAELAPEGWVKTVEAEGHVQGNSASGEMQAEKGIVDMWPRANQARVVTLRGSVHLNGQEPNTGNSRKLTSNALQLSFSGEKPGEKGQLQRAETLERGTMEWSDSAEARSRLSADKLSVDFGRAGKAQHLVATGNVETQRELKNRPVQTATGDAGETQLDTAGGWTKMMLHGHVHMKEGERSAEAQQVVFVRATQTAVLTGQAVARDETSETRGAKITFQQESGDMEAEGKVRSTDLAKKKSDISLAPAPANVTADHMTGNAKAGQALYTGHARLWQGPSVLEADTIELLRESRVLKGNGNVRATFPQVSANGSASKQGKVWHVSAATLTFWDAENRAHLEKNVVVQSEDERMRGPALDLYFTRQGDAKQSGEGTLQISRAVSMGGVVVEQGDRRGTAEQGVYTAADRKFVLSGGTPTLYDATEGTTTGRELTFNMADDTIVVDSGNGMRTLTKHRVQK